MAVKKGSFSCIPNEFDRWEWRLWLKVHCFLKRYVGVFSDEGKLLDNEKIQAKDYVLLYRKIKLKHNRLKTLFDLSARKELIQRIHLLSEKSTPLWGKMNVYQMTKHNTYWNSWVLGKGDFVYKQEFLGKIFGKMALKNTTKDDKPIGKNLPTGIAFTVKETEGDVNEQKELWANLIADFEYFSNKEFIHDFFGKMSKEQIGIFAYKHSDHHLRQFGV